MFLRNKDCNSVLVYEICFIFSRSFPFGRLTSSQQVINVIKPQFRHPVVVGAMCVGRNCETVALDQSAQPRDTSTDRAMDIFPVMKEFLISQARFFVMQYTSLIMVAYLIAIASLFCPISWIMPHGHLYCASMLLLASSSFEPVKRGSVVNRVGGGWETRA